MTTSDTAATYTDHVSDVLGHLRDVGYTTYLCGSIFDLPIGRAHIVRTDGSGTYVEIFCDAPNPISYTIYPTKKMVMVTDADGVKVPDYADSDLESGEWVRTDTSDELLAAVRAHQAPSYDAAVAAMNELISAQA